MNIIFKKKPILFSLFMMTLYIVVLISISKFALERLERQTKNEVKETLQTILHANQRTLHIWIEQRKIDIATLAKKRQLVALTSNLLNQRKSNLQGLYTSTLAEVKRYLSPELEKNNDMEFYILSKDRSIVASNNSNINNTDFIYESNKKLLNNVFNGKTEFISILSDVNLVSNVSIEKSVEGYYVVSPMQDVLGKVIAVLAIKIDPKKEFTQITHLGRLRESGETYAFNLNGEMITGSRFLHNFLERGLISKNEEELIIRIADPGFNLLEEMKSFNINLSRPLTVMALSAIQGNASFNVEGYRDYRGVKVMGVWLWDRDLNFGLTTEIDYAEGMQEYYEIKHTLIAILLMAVVLSIILFIVIQMLQRESKRKLTNAYAELESRVFERTKELEDAKSKLTKVNEELEVLSITDGLTGISNRRNFDNHLDKEWRNSLREDMSVTIIMFDIDNFKNYNDTYGHQKGDDCIKQIANMLKKRNLANRPGDLVARYGGEEFIVVLKNASAQHSKLIANKILKGVAELKIPHDTTTVENYKTVSVSVGYAREEKLHINQQNALIEKADEALYKAKETGRNKVCSYSEIAD